MFWKALLTLAFLSIGMSYCLFQLNYDARPLLFSAALWAYSWIPGVIALIWLRIEQIHLTILAPFNRYFPLALIGGFFLAMLVSFLAILGSSSSLIMQINFSSFILHYAIFSLLFFILYLGGELFWRGYAWEKLKQKRFQGVLIIAGIWSLWMIPLIIFAPQIKQGQLTLELIKMVTYNFLLTPILLDFRIRGKGVSTAAVFYASFQAALIAFRMLFPLDHDWAVALSQFFCLVVYCLVTRLYFPKHWKE